MPHCLEAIHAIYRRLGILPFDHEHGESFYNPMLPGVVEDLLAKGLAVESQGAVVVPNAKGSSRDRGGAEDGGPAGIIRKRDGAFTYTTSDLATIQYRVDAVQARTRCSTSSDFRQALHFKTLFAAGAAAGATTTSS